MFSLSPISYLPSYTGPYKVGSTEYEIPVSEIDQKASPPDARISTIKFRLFYPTNTSAPGQLITWVPSPQKPWIQAFSTFLGASLGWSSFINPILSVMNFITLPAIADAPLHRKSEPARWPLAIFSHGLAGNCNMYSAICGSLASCGVVTVAIEHRDGSSPVSWIRGSTGEINSEVRYQKYAHSLTAEVFNARNRQLRIRLWELDLLYAALRKLDEGEALSNYASTEKQQRALLKSSLDLEPGRVSWVGHSFGAATITQFVKSVYYHNSRPEHRRSRATTDHDFTPLYTPSNSAVNEQITEDSPISLLDVWTLPFRAPASQWLWEKPMPCYDRRALAGKPNMVSIMSTEFYNYHDLRRRTQALLSPDPVSADRRLAREAGPGSPMLDERPLSSPTITTPPYKGDAEADTTNFEADALPGPALDDDSLLSIPSTNRTPASSRDPSPATFSSRDPSPAASHLASTPFSGSPSSSRTSLSLHPDVPDETLLQTPRPNFMPQPLTHTISKTASSAAASPNADPRSLAPKLFHVPFSAHLSQSDFNLLFPGLTRVLMKAIDPQGTITLNIRGITAAMRNAGLDVARIDEADAVKEVERKKRRERGWLRSLVEREEQKMEVPQDRILEGLEVADGRVERWIEIPLVF
jgi:platelet-activating factor acetylhydrolase